MKITQKFDATFVSKPEGNDVWYYLFPEYEIHYNEQKPETTQTWHHHEAIHETLFVIEGELLALWREGGEEKKQLVGAGTVIETDNTPHTFENHTGEIVRYIVIKQKLSGEDKRELFKNDKVVD